MISIITVVNKPEVYEDYLLKSLRMQKGIEYEIVPINNMGGEYNSLAEAYNAVNLSPLSKWLVFVHPDIVFTKSDNLKYIIQRVEETKDEYALWGVAGALKGDQSIVVTKILQGEDKRKRDQGFSDSETVEVQTVDACCFVISREIYETFGFNSDLGGFHLAVEELCVRLGENGKRVAVIPVEIWHLSPGASLDYTYYQATIKVFQRHPNLKILNTTSFHWERNVMLYPKLYYLSFRNKVHHGLIKNGIMK